MTIKLVAIDIDGTLINDQREITPKTKAALAKATAAGVKVVLCTGRPMTGVVAYLDQLHLNGQADQYVVSYNGGLAQSTSQDVIVNATVDFDDYLDLENFYRKHGVKSIIETADYIYSANQDLSPYTVHESDLVSMPIRFRTMDQLLAMREQLEIGKVMLTDEPAKIDAILPELPADLKARFAFVRSEEYYLEAVNPKAGKGNTLTALAQHLGFEMAEVMAIGNAQNDESMIEAAGLGVAMGNSIPSTLACADVVVADNNHDGIAEAIEKYVLN